MGNFHLSIRGVGPHHNKQPYDVNEQGARFTRYMQAAGHAISGAEVTTGGADNYVPALYATASPELREAIVDGAAREAFAAHNAAGPNPGKTFDGRDVPPWEECGDQVRAKWRAAARALMGLVPLLLALMGLPAFAQDAAPAAPSGVSPVVAFLVDHLFELLASTVLPAVFLWVRTHTKGTAFESSAAVVESYLVSRVALVKPLVLEALANDGKIDAGELQRIRDAVLKDLPAGLLAPLQAQLGGGFVAWLEGAITRLVEDSVRKEAAAAGAKAAAAVPDVDAAIAAARAQRAAVTP